MTLQDLKYKFFQNGKVLDLCLEDLRILYYRERLGK